MPTPDDLKPCPFCGGEGRQEDGRIECSECCACGPDTRGDGDVEAWNRRIPTPIDDERDAIKAALGLAAGGIGLPLAEHVRRLVAERDALRGGTRASIVACAQRCFHARCEGCRRERGHAGQCSCCLGGQ